MVQARHHVRNTERVKTGNTVCLCFNLAENIRNWWGHKCRWLNPKFHTVVHRPETLAVDVVQNVLYLGVRTG